MTVVYDVISGKKDIYFEMAWASAWSLKHFNPDVHVIVLSDDETINDLPDEVKDGVKGCIDELRAVQFDKKYSNKEKSRWIKTNLRNIVKGDFLFLDTDTIITGDIAKLFETDCPNGVGMALDNNSHSIEISNYPIFRNMYVKPLQNIYGDAYRKYTDVYNSGVILVKDETVAYRFFDAWHENWKKSLAHGECRDQLSLVKTIQDMPHAITELPGIYNCQLRNSIKYFYDSVIIHTFSSQNKSNISPIFDTEMYWEIKRNGFVTKHVQDILLNCKRLFTSPCSIVGKEKMLVDFEPSYILFKTCLFSKDRFEKLIYNSMNFASRSILWILRHINH